VLLAVFFEEMFVVLKCHRSNSGDKSVMQTMKANDTPNPDGIQRELAAGILKQADQDLRRFHGAPSAIERELYLDAYRWVMSDDCNWPFSFLNVCQLLDLVPEDVRNDLTSDPRVGPFGRWVRHCTGALQRVRTLLATVSPTTQTVSFPESTNLSHSSH
jgi:hypothetical protein